MKRYDQSYRVDICKFLQKIYDSIKFDNWFAGHYHINSKLDRINILYDDIIELNFDDGTIEIEQTTQKELEEQINREISNDEEER